MSDHSKRTTVLLTVVAILFILTIIILCLPYNKMNIGHKGYEGPTKDEVSSDKKYTKATTAPSSTGITTSRHYKDTTLKSTSSSITSESPVKETSTTGKAISSTRWSTSTTNIHRIISGNATQTTETNQDYSDSTDETGTLGRTGVTSEDFTGSTDGTDTLGRSKNRGENYTESTEGTDISDIAHETSIAYTQSTHETDISGISYETSKNYTQSTHGTDISSISHETTKEYAESTHETDISSTSSETNIYHTDSIAETNSTSIIGETTPQEEITSTQSTTITMSSTTTTSTTPVLTTTSTTPVPTTTSTTPVPTTTSIPTVDPFLNEIECNKTQCKNLGAEFWLLRDTTAEPCKNFYQYACGGAVDNKYLHHVDARDAVKSKILDNIQDGGDEYRIAREFYKSCLEQDSFKARSQWKDTRNWMDELMPTMTDTCGKNRLTKTLAHIILNNFNSLFDVGLGVDDNSGKFVFRVTPPISRSPFSDDITQLLCLKQYKLEIMDKDSIDVEIEYQKYLNCMTNGTGMKARLDDLTLNLEEVLNIGQDALLSHTIEFYKKATSLLKNESFTPENLMQRNYEDFTIQEMNDKFGEKIEWRVLLLSLVNQSEYAEQLDPGTTHIQVYRLEYLEEIIFFLKEQMTQSKPVCDILVTLWKETRYTDLVAPQRLENALVPYSKEYCLELTTSLLPELLYSHNETQVTGDKKEKVSEVRENIFKSKKSLGNQKPCKIENQELLEQREGFSLLGNKEDLTSDINYQKKSLLLLRRFRSVLYTELFSSQVDKPLNRLIYSSFENAAFYPENKYFYASYMEAPYYIEDAPAYIHYAGQGAAIAQPSLRTQQCQEKTDTCTFQELTGNKTSTFNMTVQIAAMESEFMFSNMIWGRYQNAKNLVFANETTHFKKRDFEPIPWIELSHTQLFYLKSAQMYCEKTSEIDLLAVKERGHIPGPIRINKILMNERGFLKSFNCPLSQKKKMKDLCA